MSGRIFLGAAVTATLVVAILVFLWRQPQVRERADPTNAEQVALGRIVYNQHCASCHGAKLEGQPDWRHRKPNGRLPAPPHDMTGHTWEHPDETLFKVIKYGVKPFVSAQYETDMAGFAGVLSDAEIWAVIAYIKSTWPPVVLERRLRLNAWRCMPPVSVRGGRTPLSQC